MTNADLERRLDTNDEWIVTRTGIRERRHAPPEMAVSDMALRAAQSALDRAGLTPGDVDCYVVATVTPDFPFPATACLLAARLGAAGKPAFDIEIACSGFIYGLSVVAGFVRSGIFRRAMIVGAEKLSGIINQEDRATAILFGDGAGAAVVERAETDSFLACELGADGSNPELLYISAGGSRKPLDVAALQAGEQYVQMLGREIFKSAVTRMVDSAVVALKRANLQPSDVAWMVPHQANKRIIDAAARGWRSPIRTPSSSTSTSTATRRRPRSRSCSPRASSADSFATATCCCWSASAAACLGARSSGVGPPRENRCNFPGTRVAAHWDGC